MTTARASIAFVVALALVSVSTASAEQGPRLELARATPLTLTGSGFRPGEHVRLLLVRAPRGRLLTGVDAGRSGVFTVRLPLLVATQPCRALTVQAVGAAGSRALYAHRCHPPDPALP